MKTLCLAVLCILLSLPVICQDKQTNFQLSGKVVDNTTSEGVPFATVYLKKDSVTIVKAMACDNNGQFTFNLAEGQKYILNITAIGYKELKMPVNLTDKKTTLGNILLEQSAAALKEVEVTAQKPLVKMDVDKIVYSMEADPESSTNNALEMLRKVPLVTVDAEENIKVNGQSNFKVLVNGKSSTMMNSNLKEVLKSMPANTIKNIEVVTNPSSKYDAEGVGGILNIITSKKTIEGYNGSISTGINTRGSFNGSVYLTTKIKKFSTSLRYFGSQFVQPKSTQKSTSEYYGNEEYHYANSSGSNNYNGMSNGLSGEASYEIDSLNLISMSFWGYKGSYTSKGSTSTEYLTAADEISRIYNGQTTSRNSYGYLSGNIDYQKTYKKPEKSLTFSYKLDNNPSTTKYNSLINGMYNFPSYSQRSDNDATGREQTFQADYYDPLTPKHQIEGGVKFILRQNSSTSETFRDDEQINRGNDLDYDQYIMGIYAGYVFKLTKFSIKSGLRLERTWNDGVSSSYGTNTKFTNKLVNLIPYVTLSYMPKQGQTFKISYTQRLSRPDIWYLNPYVNNLDSLNISYGNPSLDAEISHSFEMGYSYFNPKFNISLTPFASFVNNSIESISTIQTSGATVTTYKNIGKNQRYGINSYLSINPSPKVNIYFNGSANYTKLQANNGYDISNKGFSFNGYLGGKITLWKDGAFNINAGAFSSSIMLQGKSSTYYYTGFGLSQYLLKRKMMLSLYTNDPFWRSKDYIYNLKDPTFYTHNVYTDLSRMARFSVTFNFGKMDLQVKKAQRGIQNDDVKSGNNNQGGGRQ
jgi:outer membrane receptor for ferrienterochelin and colicin